ncbi:MAG: ATP-dependent sacrificial sulfur transferase LarE [Lachnospiraceae bacterium]|nr:ATP-dependent sacrificial sulfur transferase LarE [Lachnospiraceae bacterium]
MSDKQEELEKLLESYKRVAVAFSSGVDSTYLLKMAQKVLGENVIAVTASSCSFPKRELEEAKTFCRENGIRHIVVESEELDIDGFRQNPKNRCYLCKHELFEKILSIAKENGIETVVEASNTDDDGDYRPGLVAVKELGIESPLRHVGLSKKEIREYSKELGLPTWNKQSFACLSSRFVYGETISEEKLAMVDQAEQLLLDMGFHQLRVRIHDKLARIEVQPSEFEKIMQEENRTKIFHKLKQYGFTYVTLDLQGYRTGSMNETLSAEERRRWKQC